MLSDTGDVEANASQDGVEDAWRREQRRHVLSEAMRAFAEATDPQGLFDTVARRVGEVIDGICFVLILSDDGKTLLPAAVFDRDPEVLRLAHEALLEPLLVETAPGFRQVIETGEPFFAPTLDLEQLRPRTTTRWFEFARTIGLHSLLAVAPRVRDRTVGYFILARFRRGSRPFDQRDLDLAHNLACHAAVAISTTRVLTDARRETAERQRLADRLRLMVEAAREFSATTYDLDHLLDVVAQRLGDLVGDMCAIRSITEDGEWFEANGATYHRDPELLVTLREVALLGRQRIGEGISGRVAKTGRPLFTPQISTADFVTSTDSKYRPFLERLRVTSAMTLPLMCRGKVVGVANLMRSAPSPSYSESDFHFAQSVADHAALAMGNARSYAAERAARGAAESSTVALRASEARFTRLSESGIVGVLVSDLSGHIEEINDALVGLLGYSREEILSGRPAWLDLTPPEWRDADTQAIAQLAASGVGRLREKEYIRKDGRRVPVLAGSAMLEGGTKAISFVLDLTELKEAQAAIELMSSTIRDAAERKKTDEQRARLAAIVDSSDDAIISKTLAGQITTWNLGAERMFGHSSEAMVGKSIYLLVPPEYEAEERAILEALARGEVRQFDAIRRRKEGGDIDVSVTISPLRDSAGTVIGISEVARDISDRKRAEAALADARDSAEAATRELEAFSDSVAHDLRAPLRGMNGFAQVLMEDFADKLDAEGQDCLREIESNALRMASLIDALLSLSRVTRSDWNPELVDLSALFTATTAQLAATEPQREVSIVVEDGLLADADPSLARALLDNLAGNAWKFTSNANEARIEFGSVEKEGTRVLFVRDNGAGFDMAYAAKMFAPFQRFHTMAEFPGTGIGLATAQRIVRRHGGRIWAEGKVGEGAVFYFTLAPSLRVAS